MKTMVETGPLAKEITQRVKIPRILVLDFHNGVDHLTIDVCDAYADGFALGLFTSVNAAERFLSKLGSKAEGFETVELEYHLLEPSILDLIDGTKMWHVAIDPTDETPLQPLLCVWTCEIVTTIHKAISDEKPKVEGDLYADAKYMLTF